jgi:hypothetical protein
MEFLTACRLYPRLAIFLNEVREAQPDYHAQPVPTHIQEQRERMKKSELIANYCADCGLQSASFGGAATMSLGHVNTKKRRGFDSLIAEFNC